MRYKSQSIPFCTANHSGNIFFQEAINESSAAEFCQSRQIFTIWKKKGNCDTARRDGMNLNKCNLQPSSWDTAGGSDVMDKWQLRRRCWTATTERETCTSGPRWGHYTTTVARLTPRTWNNGRLRRPSFDFIVQLAFRRLVSTSQTVTLATLQTYGIRIACAVWLNMATVHLWADVKGGQRGLELEPAQQMN